MYKIHFFVNRFLRRLWQIWWDDWILNVKLLRQAKTMEASMKKRKKGDEWLADQIYVEESS